MRRADTKRSDVHPSGITANGDAEDAEEHGAESFKFVLQEAFSAADSHYEFVSADDIRRRALEKTKGEKGKS